MHSAEHLKLLRKPTLLSPYHFLFAVVDAYFSLQMILSVLGCLWIVFFGKRVEHVANLPDDAWRTHIGEEAIEDRQEEMEELKKDY